MAPPSPKTPRASMAPGGGRDASAATALRPHRKPPATMVRISGPVAGLLAGRRWFPLWAVLFHRGRKSGKEYAVPVAPLVGSDAFVIGLPWGARTNWVQNVVAANGCTIRWKGREYRLTDPELVGVEAALRAAGPFQRFVLKRTRIPAFLQLRR